MKPSFVRARPFRLLTLVAAAVLASGCTLNIFDSWEDEEDDLRDAERRWERAGVNDYTLTVQRLCFCGSVEPVRVTVLDGVPVSWVFVETGQPAPAQEYDDIDRVEGLFNRAHQAIDADADDFNAEYDAEWGYPREIIIDYRDNTMDDEVTIVASLEPIYTAQ